MGELDGDILLITIFGLLVLGTLKWLCTDDDDIDDATDDDGGDDNG